MKILFVVATSGPLITSLDDDSISHARPVVRFPEDSGPSTSQPIVSSPVSTSTGIFFLARCPELSVRVMLTQSYQGLQLYLYSIYIYCIFSNYAQSKVVTKGRTWNFWTASTL
mgnify:CR=1 FL=1